MSGNATYCSNCGATVEPGAHFCKECGTAVEGRPTTPSAHTGSAAVRTGLSGPMVGGIVALVAAIAVGGTVLLIGGDDSPSTTMAITTTSDGTSPTTEAPTTSTEAIEILGDGENRYSQEIRDGYLQGCEASSPGGNFCECSLQEIEKRFTEEEFFRFAIEATEEPPEEFLEAALACLGEIGG